MLVNYSLDWVLCLPLYLPLYLPNVGRLWRSKLRLSLVGHVATGFETLAQDISHEAAQIPGVSTHFNTPTNVLRDEIAKADVVWSLTGLDGDHDRNLADAEHFGLALLELMSAGLIPIIANVGGPVEILEKFPDSLKVNSIDELVTSTITLIGSSPVHRKT